MQLYDHAFVTRDLPEGKIGTVPDPTSALPKKVQ
jgi:hypothetical protein